MRLNDIFRLNNILVMLALARIHDFFSHQLPHLTQKIIIVVLAFIVDLFRDTDGILLG